MYLKSFYIWRIKYNMILSLIINIRLLIIHLEFSISICIYVHSILENMCWNLVLFEWITWFAKAAEYPVNHINVVLISDK